jgi:hypothetical protein
MFMGGISGIIPGTNSAAVGSPAGIDPYFSNVVLLLGYDGAHGSTAFVDESNYGRSPDASLNATITTSVTRFGPTLRTTGYLRYADSAELSPGSGDFTVETFFRDDNNLITDALITKWNGATQKEWALFVKSEVLQFYYSTTGSNEVVVQSATGYSDDTWYHTAFSRVGNTGHLCFNGQIVATADLTGVTIFNSTSMVAIGGNNNGTTANIQGYIDETRITIGAGRYSGIVGATYTVPADRFPRS